MPPPQDPQSAGAPTGNSFLPGADPLGLALKQPTPADRASRILELRQLTGLSADLIDRNFDELDRKQREDAIDVDTIRRMSPALGQWLAEDAMRAAAAKTEIPRLQQVEQHLTAAAPLLRGIDNLQGLLYGAAEWAGETLNLAELTTFGREGRERNKLEAAAYGNTPSVNTAFTGPREFTNWLYNVAGEVIPMMAPSIAGGTAGAAGGGAIAGPPGAFIGGVIGAFVPQWVLGIGEVQGTMKDIDPTATAPLAVFLGGTAVGAFDTALPGKIGSRLVATFGKETAEQIARRALTAPIKQRYLIQSAKGVVTGMATEGITEAIQEAIGQVTGNVATGTPIDWANVRQAMLESGAAGAVVGGGVEGGTAAIETRRHNAHVIAAEQQEKYFQVLGGLADSELVKRAPETVRDFIAQATKDGPVETIYTPTDSFEEYWQTKGLSPDVVAFELTGDRDALARAKAEGTKLAIPTALYATKIAPTEHHGFFARELTLKPELLNIRETEELEATTSAAAARPASEAERKSAAGVVEIARRFSEVAVSQGTPKWQADTWGEFMARRYEERARRLGVDPLALWEQQPRELVIQEASGASLIPQPVAGEANELGIPASPAPRNETAAQRASRRRAHVSALASSVVRDALEVDPNVDPAQVQAELDYRLQIREEQDALARESGEGQQLLRAIAGLGGVWWNERSGHYRGEIEGLIENGRDIKGTAAGTGRVLHEPGRATYNGVAGVFREGGKPLDTIRERLAQDPEFANISVDINTLVDAIDEALRARRDVDQFPGSADLRSLGVVPGTAWWVDSWRGVTDVTDVTPDTHVDETGGILDDSFNVDEFEQRAPQNATPAQRLELLPEGLGPGTKRVPFPAIDELNAMLMRLASVEHDERVEQREEIPLDAVVATQLSIDPDDVRRLFNTELMSVLAMRYRGHFYLAGGHAEATAAWAKGEQVIAARVVDVDEQELAAALEAPPSGTPGAPIAGRAPTLGVDPRQTFAPRRVAQTVPIEDDPAAARARIEAAREAARAEVDSEVLQKAQAARIAARSSGGELFQIKRQIDTPAFTSWFGESVVTEPDGEPRVVYHGTMNAEFDAFRMPAFFSPDPVYASRFSADELEGDYDIRSAVMPVYLSIQKPLDLRELALRKLTASQLLEQLEARGVTLPPELVEVVEGWAGTTAQPAWSYVRRLSDVGLGSVLRAQGFDGAVLHEELGEDLRDLNRASEAWVVFSPEQIKSATGNRGTFSSRDANILREQLAPYQADLFDDTTPAKRLVTGEPRLATRTELVTVGARTLGSYQVRTAADAAAAMQYLARGAVERFDALVVDGEGQPLAIVGSFKGRVDEAPVRPDVILAEALQVPGAAAIWFAHNHPSGDPKLSTADKDLNAALEKKFRDTGLEVKGMLAIGAGAPGVMSFMHEDAAGVVTSAGPVRVDDVELSVPIREREFVTTAKLEFQAIRSPEAAVRRIPDMMGGKFGLVLVDSGLYPLGTVHLDPSEAAVLREGGKLRELYTTLSQSGAAQVLLYTPDRAQLPAAFNVARALAPLGIHPVDIVTNSEAVGAEAMNTMVNGQEFFAGEGGEIKGGFNPATGRMRLIAGAQDLSTFLHESGHAFLDELLRDAAAVDVSADGTTDLQRGLVRDAQTVLRWFGFEGSIAEFLDRPVTDQRESHEQWARGFEAYLMTGEAPSHELRELFAKFRAWLIAVYKVLRKYGRVDRETAGAAMGVNLPDDVRGVMDRLLASDEAIAAIRSEGSIDALFTDAKSAGVDELTFAAYRDQLLEANRKAREALDRRLLEDWRRERAAWWQQEREQVRSQVEQEASANPLVIATSVIRTGKLPDGSIPSFGDGRALKLSKKAIVEMKGADFVKRLPKPYLYSAEGGLHPDVVAELTGFSSGDALLNSLLNAKPVRPIIDAEADRQMRERHGDLLLDGMQLDELAEQAVHSNREQVISAELKALTQGMAAAAIPSAAVLRQAAVERISRTQIRDLRPGLFLQAAQRSSRQAFDAFARNDRAAAIKAKQQELTSLALYRAAAEARERSDKTASLLQEFQTSKGRRKTLLHAGEDYLDQVDAILERFQFTRSSLTQIDRRISLRKWIERQEAAGLQPQIDEWLVDDARSVHYRELTVEELEGVRAGVEQIAHLARLKDKLLKAEDARTFNEIVSEINGSIRAHHEARPRVLEPRASSERTKRFVAGIGMSHRKIASLARELDGFEDGGPMFEHVIRPLNEAGNREASMMAAAGVAIREIFERHYTAAERAGLGDKQAAPALRTDRDPDPSVSKQALLMLALNQGNEQNRQRLRDGYTWTQEQVQAALDTLDRRDWQFVQDVWDYIDTYWPQIVDKQRRVIGVPPEKVQATPVFTRFGEFRGGYFPIKFERELSGRIQNLEEAAAADMQKAAAYVHATTARGHLERRAEGPVTEHPVRLDFNVITEHLSQVIHDLTHHEALMDVGRILSAREVEASIRESLGPAAYEQFRRALKDVAIGDVPARHEVEGLLGYLRNGATVVGLGWNLTTSALQFIGLSQSVHRIGAKWVGRGMVSFMRGAAAMDGSIKANLEESELLRNRANTMSPELAGLRQQLGIDTGRITGWMDASLRTVTRDAVTRQGIADSYLWLISRTQLVVDHMTYLGAKAKAMEDPANRRANGTVDEARCIALAEQAVLDSQGGGQLKDLAAVQRGGAAWKLWINFYSFFNTTYNAWSESVRRAGGRVRTGHHAIAVGRLAVDVLLLFTLPTVLNHVVRKALTGDLDDELEDPKQLIGAMSREQLSYMAGMMVILRELGGVIEGRWGGYEGPAGARGLATISRAITQTAQLEPDEAFWRAWNQSAGVLFHYPAGQVDRTLRGIQALMDGETSNPAAVLFGPPAKR